MGLMAKEYAQKHDNLTFNDIKDFLVYYLTKIDDNDFLYFALLPIKDLLPQEPNPETDIPERTLEVNRYLA